MDVNEAGRAEVSWDQLQKQVKASLPGCHALEQSFCLCGYNAASPVPIGSSGAPW